MENSHRVAGAAGRSGVKIKELPESERPRERLWDQGAGALSTAELLAILIGTGNPAAGESALDLAHRLLRWSLQQDSGDPQGATGSSPLRYLATARPEELCQVPGIGVAKAGRIVAAIELGRRLATAAPRRPAVRQAADVARLLHENMRYLRREHLRAVSLDTKRRIIAIDTISVGGLDSTIVHPREVFRKAIQRSASAVILVHNHPSGDPTPSPEDLTVTKRMIRAGQLLGIEILDHIVMGDGRYASLRDLYPGWFT